MCSIGKADNQYPFCCIFFIWNTLKTLSGLAKGGRVQPLNSITLNSSTWTTETKQKQVNGTNVRSETVKVESRDNSRRHMTFILPSAGCLHRVESYGPFAEDDDRGRRRRQRTSQSASREPITTNARGRHILRRCYTTSKTSAFQAPPRSAGKRNAEASSLLFFTWRYWPGFR